MLPPLNHSSRLRFSKQPFHPEGGGSESRCGCPSNCTVSQLTCRLVCLAEIDLFLALARALAPGACRDLRRRPRPGPLSSRHGHRDPSRRPSPLRLSRRPRLLAFSLDCFLACLPVCWLARSPAVLSHLPTDAPKPSMACLALTWGPRRA